MLDRNRKGAICVVVEEHTIAEGVLNAREFVVWHWMGEAKTNDEIAIITGYKTATVKKHVVEILRKLGAENRTVAALKAKELRNPVAALLCEAPF